MTERSTTCRLDCLSARLAQPQGQLQRPIGVAVLDRVDQEILDELPHLRLQRLHLFMDSADGLRLLFVQFAVHAILEHLGVELDDRERAAQLVRGVDHGGADIVVALIPTDEPQQRDGQFVEDGLAAYSRGYVVLRVGSELCQSGRLLAHEIAHIFGGIHRFGAGNLMNPTAPGTRIDELNGVLLPAIDDPMAAEPNRETVVALRTLAELAAEEGAPPVDEALFDLDAVDVLAAADDHVLGPVRDVQEAVLVQVADVTGVEPAVAERLGRRLRVVEVAVHHRLVAQAHLSVLADPELTTGRRRTAGRQ